MSRIGKKPVAIPDGVEVKLNGNDISVKGPKGSLDLSVDPLIEVTFDTDKKEVSFSRKNDVKQTRCLHGLFRSLFNNNVIGVTQGYKKVLLIEGVGYRAALNGSNLELNIGFTDVKIVEIPSDITVDLPKPTQIEVSGIDKQKVGHIASLVRRLYPPEPYKGKGIRYEGEVVRRKVGKTFAAEGA